MSKKTISDDTKIDECLDLILLFMQQKLVAQGASRNLSWFDFSASEVIYYIDGTSETTQDSEDLTELKNTLKPKYHKYIPDALNKAITHEYIQCSDPKYTKLTESGSERAIHKQDEHNNRWKKRRHYLLDKILVPIITSIITSVITCYYLGPK